MVDVINNFIQFIQDDVNQVHGVLLLYLFLETWSAYNVVLLKVEGPLARETVTETVTETKTVTEMCHLFEN